MQELYHISLKKSSIFLLKLRGVFRMSFSAVNPCEAQNRYLLLQSVLPANDTKENPVHPVNIATITSYNNYTFRSAIGCSILLPLKVCQKIEYLLKNAGIFSGFMQKYFDVETFW